MAASRAFLLNPFRYTRALVRDIAPGFAAQAIRGAPSSISQELAVTQHAAYVSALSKLVPEIVTIPADSRFPDCCFIEDSAIALGNTVFITRPGAVSRRGETDAVRDALLKLGYNVVEAKGPACIDGGDVLFTGSEVFVGLSARTNRAGVAALAAAFPGIPVSPVLFSEGSHVGDHGSFAVRRHNKDRQQAASARRSALLARAGFPLPTPPAHVGAPQAPSLFPLHLKSAVTAIGFDQLVVSDDDFGQDIADALQQASQLDRRVQPLDFLPVPEGSAVNAVLINDSLLCRTAAECPGAVEVFKRVHDKVVEVDMSELSKADGALTCCSLLLH